MKCALTRSLALRSAAFAIFYLPMRNSREARADLRRFFEVDAENIALTGLERLARRDEYPKAKLCDAIATLGLDPNKPNQVGM